MSGLPVPTTYTAATGNFLTSALWNAQVRDAVQFSTDVPRFIGYQTATPTMPSGIAHLTVALDTELLDTEGGHSTTVNNSRYTVQVPGLYLVSYSMSFQSNATGNRACRVALNGGNAFTQGGASFAGAACSGSNSWIGGGTTLIQLAAGDYVELQGWQNSGGLLATNNNYTGMNLMWVAR